MFLITKILGLFGGTANSVIRNRLLNRKTPAGIMILLAGAYLFDKVDQTQVNFVVSLLSGVDLSWMGIWILILNLCMIFLLVMGCWLIFAKVKSKAEHWEHKD